MLSSDVERLLVEWKSFSSIQDSSTIFFTVTSIVDT